MRQRAALEFLDVCAAEPDVGKVIALFLQSIKTFGFDVSAGGAWIGVGANRTYRFYFNNWPKDWLDLYQAKGFFDKDPMVLETLRRMTPFMWSEMRHARSYSIEGTAVVKAFKAYGWSEVMGVPVHGPANYQGLVTVASRAPTSLNAIERALLRTMATAVHDRAHASAELGQTMPKAVAALTAREMECMRWVAVGKSDTEIGAILKISATTVHYHVERVKTKLATRSRTEAVALMVLAGML